MDVLRPFLLRIAKALKIVTDMNNMGSFGYFLPKTNKWEPWKKTQFKEDL